MLERRETLELDRRIRARWREWTRRADRPSPLLARADGWESLGRRLGIEDRTGRREIAVAVRSRPVPEEIEQEMRAVTPQALLRDLHRPETRFGISAYDRIETGWDRGGAAAVGAIRALLGRRYAIPIEELLDTDAMLREDLGELAALKASDWTQAPKLGFGATTTEDLPEEVPSIQDEVASWNR